MNDCRNPDSTGLNLGVQHRKSRAELGKTKQYRFPLPDLPPLAENTDRRGTS